MEPLAKIGQNELSFPFDIHIQLYLEILVIMMMQNHVLLFYYASTLAGHTYKRLCYVIFPKCNVFTKVKFSITLALRRSLMAFISCDEEHLSQQDEEGNTPLHLAAWHGHYRTIDALIQTDHTSISVVWVFQ